MKNYRLTSIEESVVNIAILSENNTLFGLVVDEIDDSADIVVKPMISFLGAVDVYAGSTVLGDGSIALTLDISGIASRSVTLDKSSKSFEIDKKSSSNASKIANGLEYLIIDCGSDVVTYALPLSRVHRLEHISRKNLNVSGKQLLLNYRDKFLPIVNLVGMFGGHYHDSDNRDDNLHDNELSIVVVHIDEDQLIGLEVNEIIEVYSSDLDQDLSADNNSFVLGNMVRDSGIISVLDLNKIFDFVRPRYSILDMSSQVIAVNNKYISAQRQPSDFHILCVEDSKFFRKQLKKILSSKGFKVTTADDGQEALDKLHENMNEFGLVVTDIEMPVMDGIDLTKNIRSHRILKDLPMIAVSTRFRKSDIEKGLDAGLNQYLEKLNASELCGAIYDLLEIENISEDQVA